MKKAGSLLIALLLLGFTGCSSVYMQDRANDFVDIWRIGVMYGPGALVNVRATKLAQVGLGSHDVFKFGLQGRAHGHWREYRGEGGVSFIYFTHYDKKMVSGNDLMAEKIAAIRPKNQEEDALVDLDPFYGDRSLTEFGFTAHVFAIGVDFAFDFYSFLDFLGGWLLLDPQGDDIKTRREKENANAPVEKTAQANP